MAPRNAADFGIVSDDGDRIRARRERLGVDKRHLAAEAGISRETLAAIEGGQGFRRTSLTKIERVLDKLEEEAGMTETKQAPSEPAAEPQLVTIRLPSGAGADIVVSGPVGSIDKLRETAEALLRASREAD